MKIFWIGSLLLLLLTVAYGRISGDSRAWEPLIRHSAEPVAGAPAPAVPARALAIATAEAGGDSNRALTVTDYVFLHRTRGDGMSQTRLLAQQPFKK